ncbi:MAG: hypothetical protein AAF151_19560 [Cyanobacteria bacterium J06656_5]
MLDIEFFSGDKQPMCRVEVADAFLLWLARTEFARIGEETATDLSINGESLTLPLVQLAPLTRRTFVEFFTDSVVVHTKQILLQLEQDRPQAELVYRLKKLIELLDCLKNEEYQYLQRV